MAHRSALGRLVCEIHAGAHTDAPETTSAEPHHRPGASPVGPLTTPSDFRDHLAQLPLPQVLWEIVYKHVYTEFLCKDRVVSSNDQIRPRDHMPPTNPSQEVAVRWEMVAVGALWSALKARPQAPPQKKVHQRDREEESPWQSKLKGKCKTLLCDVLFALY